MVPYSFLNLSYYFSLEGTHGLIRASPLPGCRRMNPRAGGHLHASETGGYGPSRLYIDNPWELDIVLCHHRTSHCITQGSGRVQDGGQNDIYKGGERIFREAECKAVRWGTGGKPSWCPCTSITPFEAGD